MFECSLSVWLLPVRPLICVWLSSGVSESRSWVMYSTENSHYHFKMVSVCNYMYVLSVYCFFYYSVCRHCVAVSPDSGVGGSFPTGGDIPHVPGPDSGKPPQGEGCFECDIKNQDIPLSKRAKREVHNQVSFRQNT